MHKCDFNHILSFINDIIIIMCVLCVALWHAHNLYYRKQDCQFARKTEKFPHFHSFYSNAIQYNSKM